MNHRIQIRTLGAALALSIGLNFVAFSQANQRPHCPEDSVLTHLGQCVALDNLIPAEALRPQDRPMHSEHSAGWGYVLVDVPGVVEIITDSEGNIQDITVDCDFDTIYCDDEGA